MMTRVALLATVLFFSALFGLPNAVQAKETPAASAASATLTDGEVVRINKNAASLTIKHGPMPKFNMPGMTMPYKVKDKAVLEQLKIGDRIKFDAEDVGGMFTVVRLEKMK